MIKEIRLCLFKASLSHFVWWARSGVILLGFGKQKTENEAHVAHEKQQCRWEIRQRTDINPLCSNPPAFLFLTRLDGSKKAKSFSAHKSVFPFHFLPHSLPLFKRALCESFPWSEKCVDDLEKGLWRGGEKKVKSEWKNFFIKKNILLVPQQRRLSKTFFGWKKKKVFKGKTALISDKVKWRKLDKLNGNLVFSWQSDE